MKSDPQSVRREVSRHFSHLAGQEMAIPAAERYSPAELAGVPSEAVQCSDGCGNPLLYTDIRPGDTVVDLGSGAGLDLILAARRTGPTGKVIGIDMTDAMLDLARVSLAKAGVTNAEVRRGIIEELPVESASVDWVISNCVINLSPEKARVFGEIRRILKPGGRMLISDTVVTGVPAWLSTAVGLFSASAGTFLGEEAYLAVLAHSGLSQVEVKDRTIFGAARLRKMLRAELIHAVPAAGSAGLGDRLHGAWLAPAVTLGSRLLDNKVASIKVFAQKPAA